MTVRNVLGEKKVLLLDLRPHSLIFPLFLVVSNGAANAPPEIWQCREFTHAGVAARGGARTGEAWVEHHCDPSPWEVSFLVSRLPAPQCQMQQVLYEEGGGGGTYISPRRNRPLHKAHSSRQGRCRQGDACENRRVIPFMPLARTASGPIHSGGIPALARFREGGRAIRPFGRPNMTLKFVTFWRNRARTSHSGGDVLFTTACESRGHHCLFCQQWKYRRRFNGAQSWCVALIARYGAARRGFRGKKTVLTAGASDFRGPLCAFPGVTVDRREHTVCLVSAKREAERGAVRGRPAPRRNRLAGTRRKNRKSPKSRQL